ncbi:MAG: tripartite tricarboxylate transporter substrate-binding protein [Burkholderiales bacterium]
MPQPVLSNRRDVARRLLSAAVSVTAWAAALGAALPALGPFNAALAQPAWPAKPVTIVVPFAAGGSIDVVARQVATRLAADLGQTVVVENLAGAFGTIGTQKVARATADGYTLLFAVSSPLNVAPLVNPGAVRYDTFKDFTPVATIGMLPFAIVGRLGLGAATMSALIQAAKAQPGKLNYGTDGTGSLLHITGEYLKQRAGIDMVHVPYKSAPQALTDVAGGQLDLAILPLALVQPLVQEGRVRAYAVTSPARAATLPLVPTLAEFPGFTGIALESWMGLLAPAGTPRPVLDVLTASMQGLMADKARLANLEERGIKPRLLTGDAFAELLRSERRLIADVVGRMGLKPE